MNAIEIGDWYSITAADSVVQWQTPAVAAADIFGSTSHLTHIPSQGDLATPVALGWQGSMVVIVLIALYCYILFRHRNEIRVSLKASFSLDDTMFIFENLTLEFSRFLRLSRLLLIFSIAVMMCSLIGVWRNLWMVGGATVAVWLVIEISGLLHRLLAKFDYNDDRWHDISSITKLDFAIITLVFCPTIIILTAAEIYNYVIASVLVILFGYHYCRLLRFFKLGGFSNLQWFLYLCGVEMLPFSLIIGLIKVLRVLH